MTDFSHAQPMLDRLVARLGDGEGCHTIILYGSRARGDAGPDSDYDLIGFRDLEGPPVRETGVRDGALLDIFIYPTQRLTEANADILHVRGQGAAGQRWSGSGLPGAVGRAIRGRSGPAAG